MSGDLTRRDFIETVVAGTALSGLSQPPPTFRLTIFFRGLLLFTRDRSARSVTVRFLTEAGHQTVLVTDPSTFTTSGTAGKVVTGALHSHWRTGRTWASPSASLRHWNGAALTSTIGSTQTMAVSPLNVFPLGALSGATPLKSTVPSDATLTFRNGTMRSFVLNPSTGPGDCKHEHQVWDLVTGLADPSPILSQTVRDVVRLDVNVTSATFNIAGATLSLKGDSEVLLGQFPTGFATPTCDDIRQADHCLVYYGALDGSFTGTRYYPRRNLTQLCCGQVTGDPVYCPPAEF